MQCRLQESNALASPSNEMANALRIVGLDSQSLADLARRVGHDGRIDSIEFFERHVWWWRSLGKIIGPRARRIQIPSAKQRGDFPRDVFLHLQFAEASGDLSDLMDAWVKDELGARLAGRPTTKWPAYSSPHHGDKLFLNWRRWPIAMLPAHEVDLRQSDGELVRRYLSMLREQRAAWADRLPFPVNFRRKKTSVFSPTSFAFLECIDRKHSLGEQVDNDALANARKAVRLRSAWFDVAARYF